MIGSFGSSRAYNGAAFKLSVTRNPDEPRPSVEVSRYGKLPEIHHIFKPDPQSPPLFVTINFVAMVVLIPFAALFGLVSVLCARDILKVLLILNYFSSQWSYLGANAKHLPTALKLAPVAHVVFLASLVSLEGIFFLYYTSLNLFQMLPAALAAGTVAFISGSRALGEVQGRRLAGLR